MRHTLSFIAAAAALTLTGTAQAGTVVATDVLGGPQVIDGATTVSLSGSAALGTKTVNGITAVGVTGGASGNEIDIGESMTATFSAGLHVGNVHLAYLFDGPEYNDVNEVARLTATLFGGGTLSSTLTAIGATTAITTMGSASIVAGQDANSVGAALWSWDNPFGNALVTSIKFEALAGLPAPGCGVCNPKDLENCLEDAVSLFEAAMKALSRRWLASSGASEDEAETRLRKLGNGYQNIRKTMELLPDVLGIEIPAAVEWDRLGGAFEKRHPITHNLGVVDRKYLERSQGQVRQGREVRITESEVQTLLDDVMAAVSASHAARFGSTLPSGAGEDGHG